MRIRGNAASSAETRTARMASVKPRSPGKTDRALGGRRRWGEKFALQGGREREAKTVRT